jgi:hypothetical protein
MTPLLSVALFFAQLSPQATWAARRHYSATYRDPLSWRLLGSRYERGVPDVSHLVV